MEKQSQVAITESGFYDLTAAQYHADPCATASLSRSIGWKLISECPLTAMHAHPRLHPQDAEESTRVMDFGSLAHRMILGKGADIAIGHFLTYQSKDAKAFKVEAKQAGKIPALKYVHEKALEIIAKSRSELQRFGLLDRFVAAKSEVVAIWKESETICRCMYDKLAESDSGADIFDCKFSESVNPRSIRRQIGNMGYALQEYFYRRGVEVLRPKVAGRIKFTFLFFSTEPPFTLVPVELTGEWKVIGSSQYFRAIESWNNHLNSGVWPSYTDEIIKIEPEEWQLLKEFGAETK